jgi:uncharacterized protein YndB with AHSA1/START domain
VSDDYTTSLRIEAAPHEVFPYLTESDLIVRWMGDWADLRAEPGGPFVLDVGGMPIRGEFVVVEPPRRVVFTWGAAGNDTVPPGSTTVEIVLTADGDHTVLELVHRDLPPEEVPKHDEGWRYFLPRLAAIFVA